MLDEIAIVSKNPGMAKFFALEAESCGLKTKVFDKTVPNTDEYSVIIIDTDTVKQVLTVNLDRVLLVSQTRKITIEYMGAEHILWPASIEKVKDFYEKIKFNDALKIQAFQKSDEEEIEKDGVIYFFKGLNNTVRYNRKNILLSEYEFKLLEILCKYSPNSVDRETLNRLLGDGKGNIADVYICKLRKKLESDGTKIIFTVRFEGYKIKADMEWK